MKKALLYLFFFGLLVTQSAHAFALVSGLTAEEVSHEMIQPKNPSFYADAAGTFSFYKNDVVNDNDNDNDNEDSPVPLLSVKKKEGSVSTFSFNPVQSDLNYMGSTTDSKIYSYHNFSRLPRHNYISLRVLRL